MPGDSPPAKIYLERVQNLPYIRLFSAMGTGYKSRRTSVRFSG
ncbi:hypothetical protein ANACOL_04229 [Anaerotruncus colihominis DSM 17241]|uniref:Uncharacterized protein n=1 Tax=Anaerotruncus colihominis DSM 17241 TaxID=445972 RepID=B0PHD6_9FIRM|nr:hypothetical protein ANACOL_04229 [Anaerotruncus colihominis DSM 17241]